MVLENAIHNEKLPEIFPVAVADGPSLLTNHAPTVDTTLSTVVCHRSIVVATYKELNIDCWPNCLSYC